MVEKIKIIGCVDYNSAEKSKTYIEINNNITISPINIAIPEHIVPAQAKMLFVFFFCNANMPRARERPPITIEKKGIQEIHRERIPVTIEAMLSGCAVSSDVLLLISPGEERYGLFDWKYTLQGLPAILA